MRKILVSSCLFGGRIVRYDGADAPERDARFLRWKAEGRLVSVCPETFGGLPTPRSPAERIGERVITREGCDVTEAYARGANEALRLARLHDVAFAVMKTDSPSCGSRQIYDGSFENAKIPGQGLAAQYLRESGFVVFGEDELDSAEALLAEVERL